MTSRKPSEKKSADISTTVREILNLSEETGKKAADGIRKEAAKVKEATTKAAEAAKAKKAEEKKTEETKTVAEETAPVEKKAPEKKAPVRKTTAKKTAAKAANAARKASSAVRKSVANAKAMAEEKAVAPKVFIQFAGNSFKLDEILEDAKKDYTKGRKKNFKDIQIYIKPEDGKAYYVADGDPGAVDLRYGQ